MIKRVLLNAVLFIAILSNTIFANGMTALDYATISREEWDRIESENKAIEEGNKMRKQFHNKQKARDKYSGPAALETTGNIVVNQDTTEYFSETAPAEMQSERIEVVDPIYGISFSSKRHFKTNLGEFDLISAGLEPYTFGKHIKYHFRVKYKNIMNPGTFYIVYLKAYDAMGNFVDYSYAPANLSAVESSVSLSIYGENERNIARIEFSLDKKDVNPLIMASKYVSNIYWDCNDAVAKINDPANGYSEEQKQEYIASYTKQLEEQLKDEEEELKKENPIHEIE